MNITGAEIIVQLLQRQGVQTVAGIPGGALLPLYEALHDSGIRHILARHEQGAGFIAQGMARVSGRAAVCLATSGPGATNLVTALADAMLDSVPLVCITGQVPRHLIGTDAFQEVKTGHITDSITKANFLVQSAAELLDVIPEAFRIAEGGRPGPVLIDVPKDVQQEHAEFAHWPAPGCGYVPDPPDAALIGQAAAMIDAARRPVLYLGGGVVKSGAQAEAVALAERASLPTTTTLMALGTLPAGHPLALGMLGMHGARYTNQAIAECDLLIAVGARFDDRATGRLERFCPQAKVIHIDADRRELGKLMTPTLAIEADARAALAALMPRVRPQLRSDWLLHVAALRRQMPLRLPGLDDPRTPYGIVRAVAGLAGPDAAVTTDVGQHQMWVAQSYPFRRADRWLTSGGLGTMGFGLPAAIGAALALSGDAVVCFSGDGSLLMNVQELATLAELDLNVKLVVLDNAALGMVHQQQRLSYRQRHVGSAFHRATDLCAVARAFGIRAVDLGAAGDAADAQLRVQQAFATAGPVMIRVPVAVAEQVLPMVLPGMANVEAID
ncbi:MAG TPA: biosynthetic-type acetolactate synthase large subunit [Stenotrophobium sp.]|jgi:acetolactate synthase-1/2/3 large subunit|nr:biosynthetic-type acetolactate synthase large subunit [Stenotrophobium sp.]